ncbi:MAG: tetratricopeptide repeat protein, partial [Kiritimatiellia bacterium]|nr:tetratricopeptide repeat protein [Kiritimatiellia bacterium]
MTSLIQSHWESGIGRRAGGLAVFLLFCGLFFAESARAQDRATPREVKQQAMSALQGGDYANAIIALNQLVSWYEGSEDKNIIAELEDIYYNLGLCHLLLGQFGQAREVFDTYLKKYKNASRSRLIAIFYADSFRYEKKYPDAMRSYNQSLRTYRYEPDLEVDIYGSQVRCILAGEDWNPAEPLLLKILNLAPDRVRRNWAASILTILYLRDLRVDKVYEMVPLLLQPGSFASRSVALNMAALTAGDELFSEDSYRDALWIYRLVYPYDVLAENIQTQYENTQRRIGWLQRTPGRVRESLRAQELLSEIEAEMKALEAIPPYDSELFFRTARCYMEVRRFREGGDLFFDLYLDGTSDFIEESLYLSFLCGTKIHPLDRAFSRGEEYMKAFPGGRWYDQLSLTLGILYSAQKDWPNVLRVLGTAIEVNPKHSEMVECLHLLGYAAFMEEKFSESVDYLARMNTDYPGNEREADGAYWTGMSLMFDKKNVEATPFFDQVFTEFLYKDNNVFVEDARVRSATCDFGSSRFSQAETKLLEFVSIYPESKLLGEAYLILGDISGTFGELEEAIRRYQRCVEYPLNVELYNYSIFQAGEMMRELAATAKDPAAEKRWREAGIAHFERYVEAAREESNIPMAVYWIGSAYWDLGEVERALATYQRAIQEYGHNRADLGVDLIFEDWVGRSRNAPADVAEGAWRDLRQSLVGAIREEKWSLALRIQRILMFDPKASDQEKEALRTSLLRERNIEDASPGVLEWIIREAKTAGLRDLSEKAALKLVEDFTETDYALSARSVLAALALEDKRYEDAIRHLGVIREVYADSPEAADALLILGNLYLEQQNLDAADQAYKDLLGVKKWRHLAPAAIFGRGQISEARRKFLEATVFYEQIYVLYSGYPEWTSKAYLARARVLRRLAEF